MPKKGHTFTSYPKAMAQGYDDVAPLELCHGGWKLRLERDISAYILGSHQNVIDSLGR